VPEQKANRLELTGVFGLVAPLAATLGLFGATGSIERLQRDQPDLLFASVASVLIAGTLVTVASFLSGEGQGERSKDASLVLYGLAIFFTVGGFGLSLFLVFDNASAESRPAISASLNEDHSLLTGHVSASNLTTGDRLGLKVDLATLPAEASIDDLHPFARDGSIALERAYIGPDSNGKVDRDISLSIPPGGDYTHVTIKAFTGDRNRSCTEPEEEEPDPGTACALLALDHDRGS